MRDSTREVPSGPRPLTGAALAPYTTLRLGGPCAELVVVEDEASLLAALRTAPREPLLVLAGGSNVVVADEGFPGRVITLRTTGYALRRDGDRVLLRVSAGEPWDAVVAATVAEGLAGLECLSGIPGSAGATPIQNVGAYGQDVAETIVAVRGYDRWRDEIVELAPDECGFAYRTSVFKYADRYVVLSVDFALTADRLSTPVRYAELARALDVPAGARVPLDEARAAVLRLRAGKGMVLDPADPDTYSVGSFFTNLLLDADAFEAMRARVAAAGVDAPPPAFPGPDGMVKMSAAWLIERAGFGKGYGHPGTGVAISGKHSLALTNRGGGTTRGVLALASEIRDGVLARFGVALHPEPVLVNCALAPPR